MADFKSIDIDINAVASSADSGTEVKACGCVGACEHDQEDGGGHYHGDGHAHDMIVRHSTQLGERKDGDILAASPELEQGAPDTFEAPEATGVVYQSTLTPTSNDLAQGNLGFTLIDTGGVGAGTQALAGFQAAVELWEFLLGDNININLEVGFGVLNPGVLGSTGSTRAVIDYSAVRTALNNDETSAEDTTAADNLPTGSSLSFITNDASGTQITDNNGTANNSVLAVNTANAKALGITVDANGNSINPNQVDGNVTFNSSFTWDFDPTDGIDAGAQDFVGVAFHEIGHALGFTSGVDTVDQFTGTGPGGQVDLDNFAIFNVLDLFRYSGTGQLNFAVGGTPFFSLDGGATTQNGATFSTGSFQGDGRQASHWKDGLGLGILDPTANPAGSLNNVTNLDLLAFDVMGYDRVVDNIVLGTEFANGGLSGGNMRDFIDGRAGNDTLNGLAGEDRLLGRQGNDTLIGGADADILDGGEGTDTAVYNTSSAAVNVSLTSGTGTGGDAEGDILSNIENLVGSGNNDTLIGSSGVNILTGGAGNDFLNGAAGNDQLNGNDGDDDLVGGAGADVLNGGSNTSVGDTATYSNSDAAVQINLNTGVATGGHAEGDTFGDIENLFGSVFGDTLTGDAGSNTINGFNGNDILDGGLGDDTLQGGNGDDTFISSTGADVFSGGTGNDTADYSGSNAGVTAQINNGGTVNGGHATGDTLVVENIIGSAFADDIIGNTLANELTGNDGDDTFNASSGNDTILGGGGDDFILGSRGGDIINGGTNTAVGDTASYSNSDARVVVDLIAGTATGSGHGSGDTLIDIENIFGSLFNDDIFGDANANVLEGFNGVDELFGRGGNDTLIGGGGFDFLNGGEGNDTLTGSGGTDQFQFDTANFGQDTITDFTNNLERMDFRGSGLQFADLTITTGATDTVITVTAAPVNSITLTGVTSLINEADFIFDPVTTVTVPDAITTPDLVDQGGYQTSNATTGILDLIDNGGYAATDNAPVQALTPMDFGGYRVADEAPVEALTPMDLGGYQTGGSTTGTLDLVDNGGYVADESSYAPVETLDLADLGGYAPTQAAPVEALTPLDLGGYLASDPVEALVLQELGGYLPAAPEGDAPVETLDLSDLGGYAPTSAAPVEALTPMDLGGYQTGGPVTGTLELVDTGGYVATDDLTDMMELAELGGYATSDSPTEAINLLDQGGYLTDPDDGDFGYLM